MSRKTFLGDLKAGLSRRVKIVDVFDLIIAATALTMGYTIVSNNEKHFLKNYLIYR
jgi:predicted nucleic acid-binding protein